MVKTTLANNSLFAFFAQQCAWSEITPNYSRTPLQLTDVRNAAKLSCPRSRANFGFDAKLPSPRNRASVQNDKKLSSLLIDAYGRNNIKQLSSSSRRVVRYNLRVPAVRKGTTVWKGTILLLNENTSKCTTGIKYLMERMSAMVRKNVKLPYQCSCKLVSKDLKLSVRRASAIVHEGSDWSRMTDRYHSLSFRLRSFWREKMFSETTYGYAWHATSDH